MNRVYTFVVSIFLIVVALACSKKKDLPAIDNHAIVGKWNLLPILFEYYKGNKLAESETDDNTGTVVEFKQDGVYITTYAASGPERGTYRFYKIERRLELESDDIDGTVRMSVEEFSNNKMVLKSSAPITDDPDVDHVVTTSTLMRQ